MRKGELTKKNIAEAFKKLVAEESFENITITEITNECDLNRLTFYYHFKDKTDLLNWIFYNEVIQPVRSSIGVEQWFDRLRGVLNEMYSKKDYYENILKHEKLEFKNYMFDVAFDIIEDTISSLLEEEKVIEEEVKFISYFFAFGLSGIIIEWAADGMKEEPESFAKRIRTMFADCRLYAVNHYMKNSSLPK